MNEIKFGLIKEYLCKQRFFPNTKTLIDYFVNPEPVKADGSPLKKENKY